MDTDLPVLRCEVCLRQMRPPVSICGDGHLVCPACGHHCGYCTPVQSATKGCDVHTRCYFLDDFIGKFMGYCKHNCGTRLAISTLQNHEVACSKKPCHCYIGYCDWTGIPYDLATHVDENHPDQLVMLSQQPGGEFPISLSNPVKLISLSYVHGELLWARLYEQETSRHLMVQRHTTIVDDNVKYITVSSLMDTRFSIVGQIQNNVGLSLFNDEYIKANGIDVSAISSEEYLIKLSNQVSIPSSIVSQLDCDICTLQMQPPIRMCTTGHSMCDACANKVPQCPTCQSSLVGARNYTLERIANQVISESSGDRATYPDQFLSKISKCLFCSWSESIFGLEQHVEYAHEERFIRIGETKTIAVPMFSQTATKFSIQKYDFLLRAYGQFFICSNIYIKDGMFILDVAHLSPDVTSTYWYDVRLKNPNTEQSIGANLPCSSTTGLPELSTDFKLDDVSIANALNGFHLKQVSFDALVCDKNTFELVVHIYKM